MKLSLNSVLWSPAATDGGGVRTAPTAETPAQELARLRKENSGMREQIERRARQDQEAVEGEKQIRGKINKGLTRDQAIAVLRRQKVHDAELEKAWAERRPPIIELLKEFNCLTGRISRKARMAIREINGAITLGEIERAQEVAAAEATPA